ncbi:MAG: hypothetical protein JRC86_11945 [Deltaproteobacteria bacterium]|nr:hypothetical protein [Deltaproteobacteria bacterium]
MPLTSGPPIVGQAFGGQFTADTNPLEQQALAMRQQLGNQMQGLGDPLMQLGQFTAQGGFLDPRSNPYLQDTINYAMQPAIQQFTGSTLPAFESQALNSGAFKGSSARDMGVGQMAGQFGRDLMGTAATIGYGDYANERGLMQNAGQLLDQGSRLSQLSPEILSQAGLGQREIQQRMLNEQLLQFQEQQQAPFRPLGPLASIIQGSNIGGTGFSQMQGGPQPSALGGGISGALGGATAGAGLGSLFNQGSSMAGTGWGAGLGGALGLLGGALG